MVVIAAAAAFSLQAGIAVAAEPASGTDTNEFSHSVTNGELAANRGTGTPVINNETVSDLSATLDGNTATDTVSGSNNIGAGAMAFNGIGTVVQNSGNNVVLQTATTVNVTFVNP